MTDSHKMVTKKYEQKRELFFITQQAAESFFKTMKAEWIYWQQNYIKRTDEARYVGIEVWHYPKRRHSNLRIQKTIKAF
jgi:hypothetical protein